MKCFKRIILGLAGIIPFCLAGCGNGDSAANDINNLFDDMTPDGMEVPSENSSNNNNNSLYKNNQNPGTGNPYSMYGNYGANKSGAYEYNSNYNNVYGTAPGDFNRVGYDNSGKGNIDFDITPNNFASEKNTEITS